MKYIKLGKNNRSEASTEYYLLLAIFYINAQRNIKVASPHLDKVVYASRYVSLVLREEELR